MKKIYHLDSCSTCQRIIKELNLGEDWELQNIKETHIDAKTLDKLAKDAGSYEALFNKRAMKYRSMGLNEQELTEADFRKYILSEYTFLKRPVIINGQEAFIGNAKKTVAAAKASIDQ